MLRIQVKYNTNEQINHSVIFHGLNCGSDCSDYVRFQQRSFLVFWITLCWNQNIFFCFNIISFKRKAIVCYCSDISIRNETEKPQVIFSKSKKPWKNFDFFLFVLNHIQECKSFNNYLNSRITQDGDQYISVLFCSNSHSLIFRIELPWIKFPRLKFLDPQKYWWHLSVFFTQKDMPWNSYLKISN